MEERGYVAPVELVPTGRPLAPVDPCKAGSPPVVGPAISESSVGVTPDLPSVPEIGEASTTASVTLVPASVLFADAIKELPKAPSENMAQVDKDAAPSGSNIVLERADSGDETSSDAEDELPVKRIKVEQENNEIEVVGSCNTNGR